MVGMDFPNYRKLSKFGNESLEEELIVRLELN